jgi:hypothetical protein
VQKIINLDNKFIVVKVDVIGTDKEKEPFIVKMENMTTIKGKVKTEV